MKRAALLLCLTGLAGCSTDSAYSLSRDYRSLNNEVIDALMMSTTEERAKLAQEKIIKPYSDRLQKIDKRFASWLQNTDDKEIVRDTLTEISVATLISEIPINTRRLEHEQQRIDAMVKARQKEGVDVRKEWPMLSSLASPSSTSGLRAQLGFKTNNFAKLVSDIRDDKNKKWKSNRPQPDEVYQELTKQLDDRLKALELPP